jgi:hypothetical protein
MAAALIGLIFALIVLALMGRFEPQPEPRKLPVDTPDKPPADTPEK